MTAESWEGVGKQYRVWNVGAGEASGGRKGYARTTTTSANESTMQKSNVRMRLREGFGRKNWLVLGLEVRVP